MTRLHYILLILGSGAAFVLAGIGVVMKGQWNDTDPVGMRSTVSGGDASTTGWLIVGVGAFLVLIALAILKEGKK